MAKKVLIVTKDIGEFNVYEPVVRQMTQSGVSVVLVAEGLSLQKWKDAGYLTWCPEGEFADAEAFLQYEEPDMVLTGLVALINLGAKFGLAANKFGIKLGYVHDLWGVNKRSPAVPDFVCVTDEYDEKLICEYGPYFHHPPRIYVTGSPAMNSLEGIRGNLLVRHILDYPRDLISVLVLGQDESTTPMLEGLVQALDEVGNYVLIPRFHPKFVGNVELQHKWFSILYGAKKGKVLFVGSEVSTRELMGSVKFTVSIYSTGLVEAAILGSLAVSWTSDIGREKMEQALGVRRFPLVEMNCAIEVQDVGECQRLITRDASWRGEYVSRALSKLNTDGGNTKRVVDAIMKELG